MSSFTYRFSPLRSCDGFETGGFQIFEQQILIVVLRFDGDHGFHALAALHRVAIVQRHAFGDKALQQRRMIDEFEILAAHEDLIAGRRDRFFETEELCLGREIEWAGATGPRDA